MLLTPFMACKKRCAAPVAPMFRYVSSGPVSGNTPLDPVCSFGGDYSPLNEDYKRVHDILTDQLAKDPVTLDADLVGSGLESAPEHHGGLIKIGRFCILTGAAVSNRTKLRINILMCVLPRSHRVRLFEMRTSATNLHRTMESTHRLQERRKKLWCEQRIIFAARRFMLPLAIL